MSSQYLRELGGGSSSALLALRAAQIPDRAALIFEGNEYTYRQLDEGVSQVASALIGLGLEPGDAVSVFMSNRPEYLLAVFGIGRAGLRYVPINTAYKGTFLHYTLEHSDSKALITESRLAAPVTELDPLPPKVSDVVFVDGPPAASRRDRVNVHDWSTLITTGNRTTLFPLVQPGDVASISYTSGTTGRSKGVLSPALQGLVHAREAAVAMDTTTRDRLYTCLPLFHGAALSGTCLSAIYSGATVCLSRRFSASGFWDEVRACSATQFNALGSILPMLLAQPPSLKDREHTVSRVFAAPAPAEVLFRFEERFGVDITEGYGLTETKNISYNPRAGRRVGSFGKATATSIIEIHDETGGTAPVGEVGEIVYRPRIANIMCKGYHRDPDATVAAMQDLWWHTGDVGYADEDGFFYFVDRKKDALRRRGENISSSEVESALMVFPGVLDAAAVAVRSELGEDEVMAVLEVADPGAFDREALFRHCDRAMPHFMVPRYYQFTVMPRTATGKIRKVTLRDAGLTEQTWDATAAGLSPTRNF